MKKIAIILSGSGVYDGSEIHEATLAMLSVMKQGAEYKLFAPDMLQHHVINHLTGEEMDETRNVLVESARIARGDISSLDKLSTSDFDAILFPGGFGAAKNLSDLAFKGSGCSVIADVERVIKSAFAEKKPIGALCISPAIIAKVLNGAKVTIGQDENDANTVNGMGGKHISASHGEVVIDEKYNIASTPCYMLDANIVQIAEGADNVVRTILERC